MKKWFFFCLILAFATNATAATIFSDNFNDGSIADWDVNAGSWGAANLFLRGGGVDPSSISHSVSMPSGADYNIFFQNDLNVTGLNNEFFWFTDKNGIKAAPTDMNGYQLTLQTGGISIKKVVNGTGTNLFTSSGKSIGTFHNVMILHNPLGLIQLYIDGNFEGSATDTTFRSGSKIVFATENSAGFGAWDNLTVSTTDQNFFGSVDFNGYTTYSGVDYVRDLNFTINYGCLSGRTGKAERIINNVNDLNYNLTCDGNSLEVYGSYIHSVEGDYNIAFYLVDINFPYLYPIGSDIFRSDLNAPTADINFGSISTGFSASISQVPVNLTCIDAISPKITYTITNFIDLNLFNSQVDANSFQTQNADVNAGENIFNGYCRDLAGNIGNDQNTVDVFSSCFNLVNEQTGAVLTTSDINNFFTAITATAYETNQQLNFKSPLATSACYSQTSDDTIRFDLNYSNGLILYKEFNLGLTQDINTTLNVCIATPQDFFEQLFISSQERPLVVRNLLTECYTLVDYTKYAYQDALSHRAFTISMPYSLTTYVDGNAFSLSIVNGGVESQTQLDVLLFKAQEILLSLQPDELTISPYYASATATDTNTIQVAYQNVAGDNTLTNIKIYDGSTLLFNENFTSDPNEFVAYYNFTGIDLNADVLKLTLTKTTASETSSFNRYFTFQGSVTFPAGVAALLAIIFFLFFFTILGAKASLGFFGLIVNLVALGILTLAPAAGWVIIPQAFLLIGIIYLGIISMNNNPVGV